MKTILAVAAALGLLSGAALAQGAPVAFGGLKQDSSLPVEIESDQLQVDQTAGTAVFTGDVRVKQGDMRMTAPRVDVTYGTEGGKIDHIHASGGVTLSSPTEAAEGAEAVYTIDTGAVVMTGNVLVTQGQSTIAGQRLVMDLNTGTGRMEGRVQTVFQPGKKP